MRLFILALVLCIVPALPAAAQVAVVEDELDALLDDMEAAVLAGDQEAYLARVDLSDPLFALEHTRWTDEWAQDDIVADFALDVSDLNVDDEKAIGTLTMTWSLEEQPGFVQEATYPVYFTQGDNGEWLYAGEYWEVAHETEHFVVLAAEEVEATADAMLPVLPDIYEQVTTSLDHEPSEKNVIKLYATPEALVATTLLSLPSIVGWNEPGESLKLLPDDRTIPESTLAHEFTHFLSFDMADTSHGAMPWWLEEGLAQYIASAYWGPNFPDQYLSRVQFWAQEDALAEWEEIAVFEDTPLPLWEFVYPQGYAFVRYVTETYGEDARNEWVRAMAEETPIEDATEQVFDITFEQVDADFRAWLLAEK